MNNISIRVGNLVRDVTAPASWSDFDLRTLSLFYNTLFTKPGSEYTASAFTMVKLITMAQHILQVDSAIMARWEEDCLADDPEHGQLIFLQELRIVLHTALSGLFDIEEDADTGATTYAARLNLTKNPYPSLSHTPKTKLKAVKPKTTWYYAPADGLANISLYEMAYTFTLFENYLKTDDETYAHNLIAALYRPSRPETQADRDSGWFGDRRQPLRKHESKVDERAELVKTMPALVRRLILFWFASCRQQIVERYPKVFQREAHADGGVGYGWGGVLLALAGGPVGLEAIADQHHGNGLTWLSMKEDERREQERALERMKKR